MRSPTDADNAAAVWAWPWAAVCVHLCVCVFVDKVKAFIFHLLPWGIVFAAHSAVRLFCTFVKLATAAVHHQCIHHCATLMWQYHSNCLLPPRYLRTYVYTLPWQMAGCVGAPVLRPFAKGIALEGSLCMCHHTINCTSLCARVCGSVCARA